MGHDDTETAAELEAEGHELIARGHAQLARACRLRQATQVDEVLTASMVADRYHVTMRVVTDAARRGELAIGHVGRRPVVRRSVIEAWIASRPARPAPTTTVDADETLARAAARLRRVS